MQDLDVHFNKLVLNMTLDLFASDACHLCESSMHFYFDKLSRLYNVGFKI